MSVILGIDPGKTGALAFYLHTAGVPELEVVDVPLAGGEIDDAALAALIRTRLTARWISHCFIERASAGPAGGRVSMFNYGSTYGVLRGVVAACGIPMTRVTPQSWKKALQVQADKDAARARASQLLPAFTAIWARVKDHNRAEAALIALYGHQRLASQGVAAPAAKDTQPHPRRERSA